MPTADQMAFEIHGLILALHYEARFLNNPGSLARAHAGFAHILATYGRRPAPRDRLIARDTVPPD